MMALAFGVVLRRVAARLHRERRLAGHLEAAADPDGRVLQIRLDVTLLEFAGDQHVGAGLFVQQRSVRRRPPARCATTAPSGSNSISMSSSASSARYREVGDDSDDGLADIAHLAGSQRHDRRRVVIGHPRERNHRLEIVGDVLRGEHGDDARRRLRRRRIDAHDPRMRLFAAAEGDVERPIRLAVGGVFAVPGQQPRILRALDRARRRAEDAARPPAVRRLSLLIAFGSLAQALPLLVVVAADDGRAGLLDPPHLLERLQQHFRIPGVARRDIGIEVLPQADRIRRQQELDRRGRG